MWPSVDWSKAFITWPAKTKATISSWECPIEMLFPFLLILLFFILLLFHLFLLFGSLSVVNQVFGSIYYFMSGVLFWTSFCFSYMHRYSHRHVHSVPSIDLLGVGERSPSVDVYTGRQLAGNWLIWLLHSLPLIYFNSAMLSLSSHFFPCCCGQGKRRRLTHKPDNCWTPVMPIKASRGSGMSPMPPDTESQSESDCRQLTCTMESAAVSQMKIVRVGCWESLKLCLIRLGQILHLKQQQRRLRLKC